MSQYISLYRYVTAALFYCIAMWEQNKGVNCSKTLILAVNWTNLNQLEGKILANEQHIYTAM